MSLRFHFFALTILAGIGLSCAGQSGPTQPEGTQLPAAGDYHFVQTGENTLILGVWDVVLNPSEMTVEAAPLRSSQVHFNVTKMVTPPKCYDCFRAKNLSYDPITQVMTIDIGFKNPSSITGFDVRGIVLEFGVMEFLNPDGYTDLFSPTPGQINPFVAYKSGPGQREFHPLTILFETLEIYDPIFPAISDFTYVVEASWPENCREPYEVLFDSISGDLYSDGSNFPVLQLIARDWQDDVAGVNVDLSPIGGPVVTLTPSGAIPDAWEGDVNCAAGTPVGDYEILVWAWSAPPVDQTAVMYNYITLSVVEAPTPGAEVFGSPERITNTPGESFIWPRHAVAVTGDGVSHAVWVDNSPDPESNIFHVYYSKRDGDTWTTPQRIDDDTGRAIYATIAADHTDTLHVVWEDERDHVLGSDVYYASSEDDFSSEILLVPGQDGFRHVHPRIVSADDGTLHLVWHSLEIVDIDDHEYDLWYTHRPAGGPTWEGAVSVVSQENIAEAFPAVAPAPSGAAYIAFQSDESGPHGVYFTENTSGDFIDPVLVTVSDAYQPALDVAADGSLLLGYFDYVDGTYTDIYLRFSSDGGQIWGSPQPVSDAHDAYQIAPDVECTPEGDYHVAWHEEDEMGRPGRVLYREYLAGQGWEDIIEFAVSTQMGAFPSMDSDNAGHIHVVYELFTLAEPPDKHNYEIWYRSSVPE